MERTIKKIFICLIVLFFSCGILVHDLLVLQLGIRFERD